MKKDIAQKRLEEYNDIFAEIFNEIVADGQPIVNEHGLISLPTEAYTADLGGQLHENRRDIRKADARGNMYHLIFALENQSSRDNTMPERRMGYDFAAYEEQIREIMKENRQNNRPAFTKRIHDDQKLAPVLTVVLYWGYDTWKQPLRLHDMLRFPSEHEKLLRQLVPDYPLHLIRMAALPPRVRGRLKTDLRLLTDYLAHRDDPQKLSALMKNQSHAIRHPQEFLDMLAAVSGKQQYREMAVLLKQKGQTTTEGILTMYDIEEEIFQRGVLQGVQQGVQQTLNKGIQALVEVCRENGISRPVARQKLSEKYALSPEDAETYVTRYW